jgi:hypothetical protein
MRRHSGVDNEGEACLDDVALSLQSSSDARFAIVENGWGPAETRGPALAAQRVVNTRAL